MKGKAQPACLLLHAGRQAPVGGVIAALLKSGGPAWYNARIPPAERVTKRQSHSMERETMLTQDALHTEGLEITGALPPEYATVLTPAALEFVATLAREFE